MKTYSYNEAYDESLKYFDGDSLAASTWINKYALRDSEGNLLESNPEMMHNRIIKEIMRVERMYGKSKGGKVVLTEDILKNLLYHFQYVIPGGSAMSGIGNKYRYQSISNCFVIEPPQDSYGGIFRADQELVQLMKRRGGVGTDLSNLRPNHTKVSNSALTSSGLPSFMERFSNSTREVAQGGRRGALMLSVLITHPDAEEFIDAKLVEGKIDGANISVKLTDEFMKCVKSDSKFLQKFPVDATESELGIKSLDDYTIDKLYEGEKDGTYFRVVKAKRLWDKIIKNAHDKAEPGVLFWDTILKESPADYYADKGYRTVGTNPCFTGETLIAVADGRNAVSIKDLYDKGEQFAVYCARPNESTGDKSGGWVTCVELAKAIKTGRKSVIKITLSDGSSFKCTPDHRLALDNGEYIEAKDSLNLKLSKFFSLFRATGYGTPYRFINSMSCYKQMHYIADFFGLPGDGDVIHHIDGDSANDKLENLCYVDSSTHQSNHMKKSNPVNKMDHDYLRLLNKRKVILVNASRYNWSEERKQKSLDEFDRTYGKELERLRLRNEKKKSLPKDFIDSSYEVSVVSIEELGDEEVYDLNVNNYHNFYIITKSFDDRNLVTSGILVHNCGEIPIPSYDSCRLISLNLYSFVCNPFQSNAFFDNTKFMLYARYTQRIMDNLVTIESECIERIIKKIKSDPEDDGVKQVELDLWNKILERNNSGRRTGVGITAEGDMLAALGIQYGSDEAIKVSTQIHESLAEACYIESIQLAKERGSFKVWDSGETSGFLARMFNSSEFQKVAEDYEKYGRRNISNLTIAPTGTVSLMTQTTSGIEPLFKAWYVRRRKTSDKDKAVFVNEVGDMFEEFKVIHPKFVEWYQLTCMPFCTFEAAKEFLEERDEIELQRIFETSPYYKSTAQDIDWVAKVKMQGSIQKWVDHSISCTVNLPKGTPVSVVNDVYMAAYDSGCKGVTCYVDGSRDGVLITEKKDKKSDFNLNKKRPQVLKAKITRFKNGGENWIAFVGLMNNQPYECFLGKVDDDIRYLPKSVTEGEIHQINLEEPVPGKKTPHRYDFIYEVSYGYKNALPGISAMFRTDFWNYARFLSSMLRSGLPLVDILNVIEGLSSDQGEIINSWKKGVARALRQFVQDGEDSGEICQKCGGHIVYQGGCKICTSCGDTKCE